MDNKGKQPIRLPLRSEVRGNETYPPDASVYILGDLDKQQFVTGALPKNFADLPKEMQWEQYIEPMFRLMGFIS